MAMVAVGAATVESPPARTTRELLARWLASFARSERYWLIPAAALFAWLAFLAYAIPIDPDEAVFKIVARGVLEGRWPYRDLWDNKPPLIYAWYLPTALGASIRVERMIAAVAVVSSVPVIARIAGLWLPARHARHAAWCYCLLLANPLFFLGAHTEAFMLLPVTLGVIAASPLLAGALLGLAVMTKPTAIVFMPLLVSVWGRRSWQCVLGAAIVCTLLALPFLPIWHDFWTANATFNGEFARQSSAFERLHNSVNFDVGGIVIASPVLLFAALGLFVERRLRVISWLVAALITIKATGLDYGHYYGLAAPPLALLASSGFPGYSLLRRTFATRMPTNFVLGTSLLVSVGLSAVALIITMRGARPYGELTQALAGRSGEVYVLGDRAQIYAILDRQPARRFFFDIPLAVDQGFSAEARATLVSCPPASLIVPESSRYRVDWREEVLALYRRRQDVRGATLYTEPLITCASPSG